MNKIKNNQKLRIHTVFSTAKTEYLKWITNPRIIIVFILLVFIKTLAIEPLMNRAEKFGKPLNILESFIAIGNSGMLVMLIPAVFLVLMSDFPIISGNTLFFIKRTGRTNWLLGQLLFSLMSIITYVFSVFSMTILFTLGNSKFGTNWSEVTRLYEAKFPSERDSFVSQLLPSNLYNQVDIIPTVLHTCVLMVLYLFLLSLILFVFKMLKLHSAGLFTGIAMIAASIATCSVKTSPMWLFPMANTIIWLHYTEILREPIKPVWYSYAYFAVLIVVLTSVAWLVLKKANFYTVEEI